MLAPMTLHYPISLNPIAGIAMGTLPIGIIASLATAMIRLLRLLLTQPHAGECLL
jgi:hypothetical protein